MDFIVPIKTAAFPDRRGGKMASNQPSGLFAAALDAVEPPVQPSARPSSPIVNMAMLLEILSDAGEPVNDRGPKKAPTAAERRATLAYAATPRGAHAVDTVVNAG